MGLRHEAKPDADRARQITIDSYRVLAPELLRAARAVSSDAMLAQDTVQETYLRFFLALMHGENIVEQRAWLHRVLRNLLIDAKRAERAHPSIHWEERENEQGASPGGENPTLNSFGWRDTAARVLAPREWACVRLRADGLDYREIAATLQIHTGTVAALLHRGTLKLREVFRKTVLEKKERLA